MNGAPRCDKCGSWNTVLIPMTYGERVMDIAFHKCRRLGSLLFAPLFATIYRNHFIECKQCGNKWFY